MKEWKGEFVFADLGRKTGSNRRLSPAMARPFHQCSSPPIASALYLIRPDEFRGEGKAMEYKLMKQNKGGGGAFITAL